jgi:hypothetical protein
VSVRRLADLRPKVSLFRGIARPVDNSNVTMVTPRAPPDLCQSTYVRLGGSRVVDSSGSGAGAGGLLGGASWWELLGGWLVVERIPTLTACDHCHSDPVGLFVGRDKCHLTPHCPLEAPLSGVGRFWYASVF